MTADPVDREDQRVESSFVQDANFQINVGRRYRDRQLFVGQWMHICHWAAVAYSDFAFDFLFDFV